MRGYLIDAKKCEHDVIDINDDNFLKEAYRLIGCRCIDITVRTIEGKPFNIVLDDEGLLKPEPILSAVDGEFNGMFVGNLIVFEVEDETLDLQSLSEDDVDLIKRNVRWIYDFARFEMSPLLVMEY